MRKGNCNMLKY